jgi:Skp family chaperone for outer membrane proteins
VNQKLLLAALVVLLVVMSILDRSPGTPAAEPAAENYKPVSPVAVVDLTMVFRKHARFADRAEKMEKDSAEAWNELKARRAALYESIITRDGLTPGTDDYQQLNEEIIKASETLSAEEERQNEEFLRQEAAIYSETFDEIEAAIREYGSRWGIKLVLRFNSEPLDQASTEEIKDELGRYVLYQDGIDITNDILEMVNGSG